MDFWNGLACFNCIGSVLEANKGSFFRVFVEWGEAFSDLESLYYKKSAIHQLVRHLVNTLEWLREHGS